MQARRTRGPLVRGPTATTWARVSRTPRMGSQERLSAASTIPSRVGVATTRVIDSPLSSEVGRTVATGSGQSEEPALARARDGRPESRAVVGRQVAIQAVPPGEQP